MLERMRKESAVVDTRRSLENFSEKAIMNLPYLGKGGRAQKTDSGVEKRMKDRTYCKIIIYAMKGKLLP